MNTANVFSASAKHDRLPNHIVYIDGACKNNGQADAQASYGVYWGDNHPLNTGRKIPAGEDQTNNRGELWAAIAATEQACEENIKSLIIRSDSEYVVKGMNSWIHKWMENSWTRSRTKEPVLNRDLWEKLLSTTASLDVKWKHVKGHCGIKGNEEADSLAVAALKKVMCTQPLAYPSPVANRLLKRTEVTGTKTENNCLTCKQQDIEPMIQCNMCSGWIHLHCSALPLYQIYWLTNTNRVYSCQYCAQKDQIIQKKHTNFPVHLRQQ